MEYLVIYDEVGNIFYMAFGNSRTPQGLPYMMVTIPENKTLVSIDVSGETHVPVFVDLPVPETTLLKEKLEILQGEVTLLNDVVLEQIGL